MTESATGIILRTRPLTETSLIVHWLTPDARTHRHGRQRRAPDQVAVLGKLDLFYLADFSFSRSRRSDLHTLREVSLRETHGAIRADIVEIAAGGLRGGVHRTGDRNRDAAAGKFRDCCADFLNCFATAAAPQLLFAFEFKLLRELGLEPDLGDGPADAGTKKIAAH